MGRLTTFLLVASMGAVGAVATPAFLAASTGDPPIATLSGHGHGLALPHPLHPLHPPPAPPEIRDSDDPTLEPDDEDALPEPPGQLGQTRQAVLLRERPAASSSVMGKVDEGELVSILRVTGDWALVYYGGSENLVAGWAKKSEIAIR